MRTRWCLGMVVVLLLGGFGHSAEVKPDLVVAADGTGDFKTVQAAVASIPADNRERKVILIKDGVYAEKVRIDAPFVTLRGESRKGTRIEFAQLNDDFTKRPDELGRAVVNINAADLVLENLTIANTAGVVGPHAFAVHGGGNCDRTVIVDCDVLSDGADTVSLWQGKGGRYYHARCNFRGAVDFVCPRGWCYVTGSTFYETKSGSAAVWHDGSQDKAQKFVLRDCRFDGVEGWVLARRHHDGQIFWLDCVFSRSMADRAPYRVVYPIGNAPATAEDVKKNEALAKTNRWGNRFYFYNCRREGAPDFPWHADNLNAADGSPKPEAVTARWTFGGTWDPERGEGPGVIHVESKGDGRLVITFAEPVTVKGTVTVKMASGKAATYSDGSGSAALTFDIDDTTDTAEAFDFAGGAIVASRAAATLRAAAAAVPAH